MPLRNINLSVKRKNRIRSKRRYKKRSKRRGQSSKQRGGTKISFNSGKVIKVGTRSGSTLTKLANPIEIDYPKKENATQLTQLEIDNLALPDEILGKPKTDLSFVMFPNGCDDILGVPK